MKDVHMAIYCDFAAWRVQNCPEELKRLHSRGELSSEEYKLLSGLWTGEVRATDMLETVPTVETWPGVREAMEEGAINPENESIADSTENIQKIKEFDRREAFRKRVEEMKRLLHQPDTPYGATPEDSVNEVSHGEK